MAGERAKPRRGRARWITAVVVLLATGGGSFAYAQYFSGGPAKMPGVNDVRFENAEHQAALVDAEDDRLMQVRAVAAIAPRGGLEAAQWRQPYRLNTGSAYTLVLTSRSAPYTIADLIKLAPQTFTRLRDGSYLLTEHIYVNTGAKLLLQNPGGLTIRLASGPNGFVSIVSFGGTLTLQGTAQVPMRVVSWDPKTNKVDQNVNDGRAYVRAIGGQFDMNHTHAGYLGFWSGRTGGIAPTGTDRPNVGSAKQGGPTRLTKDQRHDAKQRRLESGGVEGGQPPRSGNIIAQPPGKLQVPSGTEFEVPTESYVSVNIKNSRIIGNAYGVFVSAANGIEIADTRIEQSLIHGVVMHRFAKNGSIERTVSVRNRGDGFVLARATEQIRVDGSTAEGNGGNGFTLNGQPLAHGPSASGESVASYGNNSVASSVARANGRYGIEILGGANVGVNNNRVEGGDMGIVVRQGAGQVKVVGNQLTGQRRQGVSIRDGVTGTAVTGNIIRNVRTGVYVRGSVVAVQGNTVQGSTSHGVTFVGAVGGSEATRNTIAGAGPSAVDRARSTGDVIRKDNQTGGWKDTSSLWIRIKRFLKPMNLIWAGVFLLVITSAIRSRGTGPKIGRRANRHPYDRQRLMEERPVQVLKRRPPSTSPNGSGPERPEVLAR
ncbi:right-handed parallel beta-helix repeat-containing protein [Actinomadura craniellae]|uniref:Right-handed parallel beta-helix repeat-containing protein n=1 Tax=Actinomadura craniellae TaxID=2231787 RepID=A0A365H668_9ACTN|nr:right-handed parallel beta-helix repeat-containing protein [Actinomadura craniellae]RAY14539.1 right-handed parallel beta-helix repeat-containing protein [Actinomadura craniellae]